MPFICEIVQKIFYAYNSDHVLAYAEISEKVVGMDSQPSIPLDLGSLPKILAYLECFVSFLV